MVNDTADSDEEDVEISTEHLFPAMKFTGELIANVIEKYSSRRRYLILFIRLCSTIKILSSASYKFLSAAFGDGLLQPRTLRSHAHPDEINVGLDLNHLENVGEFSENLEENFLIVSLLATFDMATKKLSTSMGDLLA